MTPLEAISAKGWEAVVNTNLTGGFLMARECYLQSMNKTGGSIVNIVADMWGSMPGMGHSGAARAGMVSFTETAAVEWAAKGVRVNAVAPGYIASSGMDNYPRGDGAHDSRDGQDHTGRALWHRGRNRRRHRVSAEPRGVVYQWHHVAHRRRTPAGPQRAIPCACPMPQVQARDAVKPFRASTAPKPLRFSRSKYPLVFHQQLTTPCNSPTNTAKSRTPSSVSSTPRSTPMWTNGKRPNSSRRTKSSRSWAIWGCWA